ncbi:MAG TPA: protein BatD [Rhodothermales bacterium]|nr:protein BatD [Rhodothermales bacterium]
MRLPLLASLLALMLAAPASAQVAVSAYADKTVLEVGESLLFVIEVSGGEPGGGVMPPRPSPNLALVSRSPVLRERTTLGAQTQTRLGWRYRATRPGAGRIGAMQLQIGSQSFSTDPIPIDVVQRNPPSIPNRQARPQAPSTGSRSDLFVRAEPRRTTAVVGQQVVVDYVLYFDPSSIAPRQALAVGTWDAPGFWREEMDVPTRETYPRAVTLDGRAMQAVTVRRLALFPARAGTLELAPMEYEVEVREADPTDPFLPFFQPFSTRRSDREVTAPGTSIEVRPLPSGAPPSFAGAVGEFEMVARLAPDRVAPGDPVELVLTLRGTGNAATLTAPEIDAPAGVDAYTPEDERSVDRGRVPLRSARTFTYTFVPQNQSVEIPAVTWSYFDPAAGEYRTISRGPFRVSVEGSAAVASAGPAAARWRRSRGLSTGGLWALLGVGLTLPLVAGLGLVATREVKRRRSRAARRTPATVSLAPDRPSRERAAALDAFVRQSLSRADPRAASLSRSALLDRARQSGIDADALGHLLAEVERARFAGGALPKDAEARVRALLAPVLS